MVAVVDAELTTDAASKARLCQLLVQTLHRPPIARVGLDPSHAIFI